MSKETRLKNKIVKLRKQIDEWETFFMREAKDSWKAGYEAASVKSESELAELRNQIEPKYILSIQTQMMQAKIDRDKALAELKSRDEQIEKAREHGFDCCKRAISTWFVLKAAQAETEAARAVYYEWAKFIRETAYPAEEEKE